VNFGSVRSDLLCSGNSQDRRCEDNSRVHHGSLITDGLFKSALQRGNGTKYGLYIHKAYGGERTALCRTVTLSQIFPRSLGPPGLPAFRALRVHGCLSLAAGRLARADPRTEATIQES
jgi:hypothetical protein